MKKVLLIAIAAISVSLTSCLPKFSQACYVLDYQQANQGGKVFFTESNSVNFDYEPIASLIVVDKDGVVSRKTKPAKDDGEIYAAKPGAQYKITPSSDYRLATCTSALNYAAKCCIEMGGDAIINLQFDKIEGQEAVYVKGMVIKRK